MMSCRFLISCLLVLGLAACKPTQQAPATRAPLPVTYVTVHAADEPHWIQVIGQAEGGQQVEVRPQVGGILKRLDYREGDLVKAGDILFEIDDAPFRAQLDSARSARLRAADELKQAERELKRAQSLYKSGAGTKKDFDDAQSTRNQKSFALNEAKAQETDAAISLSWTKVAAPASGYASRAEVKPGALVSANSTLLATITQHDDIRVVFAPSDRDLSMQPVTMKNHVRVFRKDGSELAAKLDYVAKEIDPNTSTRIMRAKVSNPGTLLPGEFVNIRLQVSVDPKAYRVPQKAVLQLPDGTYAVYVINNGKAVRKPVEVGLWEGQDWIVRKGLADGDQVITNQLVRLQDGSAVSASPETSAAPAPAAAASAD